jgi:CYTH domain-containing protein
MPAKLEIERKFLLKAMPDRKPDEIVQIEQWYYKNKKGIWERARTWNSTKSGENWIHTVKKSISKGVSLEDERPLSREEFEKFTDVCMSKASESRFITKERYIYKSGDLKWEIDKFDNGYHLIIAEIEIPKKSFKIEIPDFIGELILLEVTGLKQFNNRNLSMKLA